MIVYLKYKELQRFEPTLFDAIHSHETSEFDVEANWISVNITRLDYKLNAKIVAILKHKPELALPKDPVRPNEPFTRASDIFVKTNTPQPPNAADIETAIIEYFDQCPWYASHAAANVHHLHPYPMRL